MKHTICLVLLVAGCSSATTQLFPPCRPGDIKECPCGDAKPFGEQTCNKTGWMPCQCDTPDSSDTQDSADNSDSSDSGLD